MSRKKRIAIFAAWLGACIVWAWYRPELFLFALSYSISLLFTAWGVYHIALSFVGSTPPLDPELPLLQYPKLSIMIPARNEPLLPRTIDACLFHTEYPEDQKEIVVVADDPVGERIGSWFQQKYPGRIKLMARKQMYPTKPSALNDALSMCTGQLVAVMDVEDIPDRDVFVKAAAALTKYDYAAVQAILRISNADDNWITKVFSMEYAGWFRIWLNARYKLRVYAPLGGTGNYFKRSILEYVGGWDATNLAEDAEVGIRLALAGGHVAVIDSRHWEEAPVNFEAWLKQRTRWFRGWMQSLWKYLSFLGSPTAVRRLGLRTLLTVILMLLSPFIVVINWVAYGLTLIWFLYAYHIVNFGFPIQFPFWMMIPFVFNFIYYYVWLRGASLEGMGSKRKLAKYVPHMFFYCNIMMPVASIRALYQEIFKPVFWEKTTHPGRGVRWAVTK
jgi:cellulose synthase/poly-beta-1,6-N-acetylglucosamine synthase-like glycosyltransferase